MIGGAPLEGEAPLTEGRSGAEDHERLKIVRGLERPRRRPWSLAWKISLFTLILTLIIATSWILYSLSRPSPQIRSLAVLLMENLSGEASQDYFADGMTDELITDLAQISALRVISRTSVMPYKSTRKSLAQIARELDVDAVVEGTVLRSGEQVRITAAMILTDLLNRSKDRFSIAASIALVYVGLGEKDQAMSWLNLAYRERFNPSILMRPSFDPLRSDSRFQDLLHRRGIV